MRIRVGAVSDVGRVRTNNEDSFVVQPPLYAVADGMGGVQAGEVASSLALDTVKKLRAESNGDALAEWVRQANRVVYERSQEDKATSGMGTTLTAMLAEDDQLRLAHVGDTRAYLLRNGSFRRLTEDHSVVHRMVMEGTLTEAQAEVHPDRNILTRALGIKPEIPVDETMVAVRDGDRIMLCSDGLHGMVKEPAMKSILQSTSDPQAAAQKLVDAANANGGVDNVTAVVLDVDGVHGATRPAVGARPARSGGGRFLSALLAALAALILAYVLHLAGIPPFSKKTAPSKVVTKTKVVDPISRILTAGTVPTAVRYGDVDGDSVPDVAVTSARPGTVAGGPFLDVGLAPRGGGALKKSLHVDLSAGSAAAGGVTTAAKKDVVLLDLVDFQDDGSKEIVVVLSSTNGTTRSVEVRIFSATETPNERFTMTFGPANVFTDSSHVYVQSSTANAPTITQRIIGYDPASKTIKVTSTSTLQPGTRSSTSG